MAKPQRCRNPARIATVISMLALLMASLATATSAPAAGSEPLRIWVSTDGSDGSDGLSRSQPVATLARVHEILCPGDGCPGLGRPVEVRIEPGTYVGQEVVWRYYDDEYPTTFMPADYEPGWVWADVAAHGGRPVFDGQIIKSWGLNFQPDRASSTDRTNLGLYYLEWENYIRAAVHFTAGPGIQRPSDNTIYGNHFHDIGNLDRPEVAQGWAGVFLSRADRNTIRNNHFIDIVNSAADRGHEHGVYLHNARGNEVSANRFERIGGGPVRIRHQAADNLIENNTFIETSRSGYVDEWYCRPSRAEVGACGPVEYRSFGNVMRDNTFGGGYGGAAVIPAFCHDYRGACPPERTLVE